MMLILTAPIQTGKTRWLEALIAELASRGVASYGVVAPGRWHREPEGGELVKDGIDNVLLPSGERVRLAEAARGHDGTAGLGWSFDADVLARVDGYFAELALQADGAPGLLVVDELGPLELKRGEGLVHAVRLLERGPAPAWLHAIVVVRPALVLLAKERFQAAWGDLEPIVPGDDARELVFGLLGA